MRKRYPQLKKRLTTKHDTQNNNFHLLTGPDGFAEGENPFFKIKGLTLTIVIYIQLSSQCETIVPHQVGDGPCGEAAVVGGALAVARGHEAAEAVVLVEDDLGTLRAAKTTFCFSGFRTVKIVFVTSASTKSQSQTLPPQFGPTMSAGCRNVARYFTNACSTQYNIPDCPKILPAFVRTGRQRTPLESSVPPCTHSRHRRSRRRHDTRCYPDPRGRSSSNKPEKNILILHLWQFAFIFFADRCSLLVEAGPVRAGEVEGGSKVEVFELAPVNAVEGGGLWRAGGAEKGRKGGVR